MSEVNLAESEFYEKYSNVVVKFSSYHKHTFNFEGKLDEDRTLHLTVGGNSSDIYIFLSLLRHVV